jgi:hypothetical protein
VNDWIKPPSGLFVRLETRLNRKSMFYQFSAETSHFTVIPDEAINILFKQLYYNIFVL